jgi:uncharacterized membrane protein YkoI
MPSRQAPTSSSVAGGATTGSTTGSADPSVAAAVRALQSAARAVPQGKAFDLDQETRGGQPVWDVKVASGQRQFDLAVAADGSRVLTKREDPTPDDDVEKLRSVRIDAPHAIRLAAQHQTGNLTELDLEATDAGTVYWEVDFQRPDGAKAVVDLHAGTGRVLDPQND